jgi:hypothetical protein
MTKKAAVQGAATFQKYDTEFWRAPKSSKFCLSACELDGRGGTCHSEIRRLRVSAYDESQGYIEVSMIRDQWEG